MFDIGDEVLRFFQADSDADQVAAVVAVGAAEGLVGHHEAGDAAPAVADFEEAQGFDEFYDSRGRPRVVEDNGEDAGGAGVRGLAAKNGGVRGCRNILSLIRGFC